MKRSEDFRVVRVQASLMNVDEDVRRVLKRHGKVVGQTISRTFIVPDDMHLWALHYAMTTAFGFLNEHLHAFRLTDRDMMRVTGGRVSGWYDLVGRLFRSPYMDDEDEFWCEDYYKGSFRNWRRRKYTGPYVYGGKCETFAYCRRSIEDNVDLDKEMVINYATDRTGKEMFAGLFDNEEAQPWFGVASRKERRLMRDLEPDMLRTCFERDYNNVLQSLSIRQVMEDYTTRLIWNYDFGDDWNVLLEFSQQMESKQAEMQCRELHRPVMIAADGLNLVEDAGSTVGFATLLLALYGSPRDKALFHGQKDCMSLSDEFEDTGCEQYEDRESSLVWADSLEWSERLPALDKWF